LKIDIKHGSGTTATWTTCFEGGHVLFDLIVAAPLGNKEIRERGVPVTVREKFKQFHGFSNLGFVELVLKCFHFLTQHMCLCLLIFNEPLFLHPCSNSHSVGIIKTRCISKAFANLRLPYQTCTTGKMNYAEV